MENNDFGFCKVSPNQPKTKDFGDFVRKSIENTKLTGKEHGFVYLINDPVFENKPITPVIEGGYFCVKYSFNLKKTDFYGTFHTHPTDKTEPCYLSDRDIEGMLVSDYRLEEVMVGCPMARVGDRDIILRHNWKAMRPEIRDDARVIVSMPDGPEKKKLLLKFRLKYGKNVDVDKIESKRNLVEIDIDVDPFYQKMLREMS